MKTILAAIFVVSAFGIIEASFLRGADSALTQGQAIEIVKALNTTELDSFLKDKLYLPLPIALSTTFRKPEVLNGLTVESHASWGRVRNYKLSVVLSSDKKHYKLGLTPESDNNNPCAVAYFSDESGIIYRGTALDCTH